jgi:hypothetical protein
MKNEKKTEDVKKQESKVAQRFQIGKSSATIWKNDNVTKEGKEFTTYSVTFQRVYYDKDDKANNTQSFQRENLIELSMLLDRVASWLYIDRKEED